MHHAAAESDAARRLVCEHTFVPTYVYSVTEHDPDRPWIVVGSERRSVDLQRGEDFFDWVSRSWPAPRFSVQLDPWQLQQSDR